MDGDENEGRSNEGRNRRNNRPEDKDEIPPIRLKLLPSSCGKPTLRMTLDEPQENDETFHDRGLAFLIDKQLFEQVKPVKIDYVHTASGDGDGFSISANLSKAVSSGSCL
jgi:Fe-S cluster assembly iron-binding protein IscA